MQYEGWVQYEGEHLRALNECLFVYVLASQDQRHPPLSTPLLLASRESERSMYCTRTGNVHWGKYWYSTVRGDAALKGQVERVTRTRE